MAQAPALLAELKREAANTRIMLQRLTSEKFQWRPHEKSSTLLFLATHIANIPVWTGYIVSADEYDLINPLSNAGVINSTEELLTFFDQRIAEATSVIESTSDDVLNAGWALKRGEHIVYSLPKKVALRYMVLNHIVHHRGQLSVYLRLLDIPVPGMYGPSADDKR